MFYHQKVARVRVFADIQNFALRAHCVHGIPHDPYNNTLICGIASRSPKYSFHAVSLPTISYPLDFSLLP